VNTGPTIDPVDSTPFTGEIPDLNSSPANPITDPDYLRQYAEGRLPAECLPTGLDPVETIKNPARVLEAAITQSAKNIVQTVVIKISTVPVGQISNIPFVVQNANATRLDAIFWIEKVADPSVADPPGEYIQLQYVQRVILAFPPAIGAPIIQWPHISVATLVKAL
jgi:hypothetical protein